MRLTLIILLISILQNAHAQSFTQFVEGDSIVAGAGCSMGFYRDYTFKPKDASSYKHIVGNFGKDKYQAYYKGQALPYIKPAKAKVIYAKEKGGGDDTFYRVESFITDGKKLYYNNTLMENADINDLYYVFDTPTPLFASNDNAYLGGHLLSNFNLAKATMLSSSFRGEIVFFTDDKHVYRNEVLLPDADPKSFELEGYTARKLVDGAYVAEAIADSRDNRSFYFKGKKVTPYPEWKETRLFPDSIYNKHYLVTFTSEYQTQDIAVKPAIDFYLTPEDFAHLTKNKTLRRKKELQLNKTPVLDSVKGYKIQVFKDRLLESTYYYEEDLEELDIDHFTEVSVAGDGFHWSKEDFNLLRQHGIPVNYFDKDSGSRQALKQKIVELDASAKLISHDTYSYCLCSKNAEYKDHKLQVYDYSVSDNQGNSIQLSAFEGVFRFKMKRNSITKLLGVDLGALINEKQQSEKNKLVTTLFSRGVFYADQDAGSDFIQGEEWSMFDIYCSKEFMAQVPAQYVQDKWQPIRHLISWQEM